MFDHIKELNEIDAVAIFGSSVRNQTDKFSDRDILLISNNHRNLISAAKKIDSLGWSATKYNWNRIEKSSSNHLLFVQHLKQESIILKDKHHKLSSLLYKFSLKINYDPEVNEAKQLLSILSLIPNSTKGQYWALDVLMVGLRSLVIPTLANEGIYCFSFHEMLNKLCVLGILNKEDAHKLIELREVKTKYRKGNTLSPLRWKKVLGLINLVSKRFNLGLNPKQAKSWEIIDSTLNWKNYDKSNWYINSRKLEASLISAIPDKKFSEEVAFEKKRLNRFIKAPGDYAWFMKNNWDEIIKDFSGLVTMCNLD